MTPAAFTSGVDTGTTVVITCFNQAHFLGEAICSARHQTMAPAEIIVVDDGSTDDTLAVAYAVPGVRVLHQSRRGLSAARNAGLRECSSEFVIFLDADDRLLSRAVESGTSVLRQHTDAAFACGRFRYLDSTGGRQPSRLRGELRGDAYLPLLRGNFITMHGTVTYRRSAVTAAGGFDETMPACEDYDLYLRLAREYPLVPHNEIVAEYRLHDANMSRDSLRMLDASVMALRKQLPFVRNGDRQHAYSCGLRSWRHRYGAGVLRDIRQLALEHRWREALALSAALARVAPVDSALLAVRTLAGRLTRARQVPPNQMRWGSLRRSTPLSSSFGFDRGQPVDRYYIEAFLREFSDDIRGRVLEVGDDHYTRAFSGGTVTQTDILHVDDSNPRATIVADLASADHIPANTFDCIIVTQTLQMVYDLPAAVRTLHRILKPNGVVLATVPGITPVSADRWAGTWYWALTELAARRLFESVFARDVVTYSGGNVLVATAFLYGLAAEELTQEELDHLDLRYPVTIGIRATK